MSGVRFSVEQLRPELRDQARRKLGSQPMAAHWLNGQSKAVRAAATRGRIKAGRPAKTPHERLSEQLRLAGIEHVNEFRWHESRRYRADIAMPELRLLVEIQGGIYSQGRHVRGKGYEGDRYRSNEAVLQGYRMLEFTPGQIRDGLALRKIEAAVRMVREELAMRPQEQ